MQIKLWQASRMSHLVDPHAHSYWLFDGEQTSGQYVRTQAGMVTGSSELTGKVATLEVPDGSRIEDVSGEVRCVMPNGTSYSAAELLSAATRTTPHDPSDWCTDIRFVGQPVTA